MKKSLLLCWFLIPLFVSAQSTGFLFPTATPAPSGGWTNPANAFASDDVYTTVPHQSGCRCPFLYLSWDNGVSWTSPQIVGPFSTIDNALTAGSSSDLWGHAWVDTQFTNANFRLKIANPSTLIEQGYGDFNFVIPSGSVITGIEVMVEEHGDSSFTTEFIDAISVNIHYVPACADPTGLAVSNITNTGADFDWDSIPGITGFEYVLDNILTDPAGVGTPTTANSFSATSLNPGSSYYFHLRVDCGSGDLSNWVTIPFNTTTLSLAEIDDNLLGKVYPNPSTGIVNIKIHENYVGGTLTISDIMGKVLANIQTTNTNTVVDISSYNAQIYYFIYAVDDKHQVFKVVKQ